MAEIETPPPAQRGAEGATRAQAEQASRGMRAADGNGLEFAPGTYDAEAGTCEVIWSTGAAVERRDWWTGERYSEVLDLDGADLTRFNAGGPLLGDHWNSIRALIGSIVPGSARVEGGRGLCSIRFDRSSPEGQAAEAKVAGGHLRSVSIGYMVKPDGWEKTRGADDAVIWTARSWEPYELSLVAAPADAGAALRSAPGAEAPTPDPTNRGASPHNPEASMPNDNPGAAAPVSETRAQPDAAPTPAAAPVPATAPIAELRAIAEKCGLGDGWALDQAQAGLTLEAARAAAIDAVAARSAQPVQPSIQVLRDQADTRRAGVEGWLLHRLAPGVHKLEGAALDYRGCSLLDLARISVEAAGGQVRGLTPSEIARAALNLPGHRVRGMGTTADFPYLLANAQSKQLLTAYAAQPRTFQAWAGRRDLPDFKTARIVELGAAPNLLALGEGANIQYGQIGEGSQTWALVRYARNMALSYVAIVNDDLGGFQRIPAAFATAAANLENRSVYGILNTPPTMTDGTALFSSSRTQTVNDAGTITTQTLDNLGSGALTDAANFATLRTKLTRMKDATGQEMNIMPDVLLVPSELEAQALATFATSIVAATLATTAMNPYRGTVEIVSTPFLTDANDWFVTVRAGSGYESVEYGYEQGASGPELTSYTDPDYDGVVFSCRHSFGAAAATFRTIAKSAN